MKELNISEITGDPSIDISLNTIKIGKQAIVFVNSKRSAESVAEKIAKQLPNKILINESEEVLSALSRPTKQCERLSKCIIKGVSFHHAGLNYKQRELIEDKFREGKIKIIVSTPTLAYGLDMPAFRAIIRDLKRYGGRWGSVPIPVLEYLQMAGRAGRPGMEDFGEAICIANSKEEEKIMVDTYVKGEPEEIFSKLAAEPTLRTYILSLIATGFANTKTELFDFFNRTFYAHQFGSLEGVKSLINKIIGLLEDWEFLEGKTGSDFISASKVANENLKATKLGVRVAELYLDPYTANDLINGLRKASSSVVKDIDEFSYIQLCCDTLELRPLFRAKNKDLDFVQQRINQAHNSLICEEYTLYDDDYDSFLDSVKTSIVFEDWSNEIDEHQLLEKYDVRPGEFNMKLANLDWLLYCLEEFGRMMKFQKQLALIKKTRYRLKHGVKEELIPLLQLKNIGRVRARKMFNNGIRDISDVKKTPFETLAQLIGKKTSVDVKSQVGEDVSKIPVKENKRKGQISLNDF